MCFLYGRCLTAVDPLAAQITQILQTFVVVLCSRLYGTKGPSVQSVLTGILKPTICVRLSSLCAPQSAPSPKQLITHNETSGRSNNNHNNSQQLHFRMWVIVQSHVTLTMNSWCHHLLRAIKAFSYHINFFPLSISLRGCFFGQKLLLLFAVLANAQFLVKKKTTLVTLL